MKISVDWVREFVRVPAGDGQLAEALTRHGIAVEGASTVGGSAVFEVEFTTNRPDAMNHYGVARECSAIYDVELKPLMAALPAMAKAAAAGAAAEPEEKPAGPSPFPVVIEDPEGCARYTARVIRGVKIAPAPEAVVRRLESVEQRPINNVADASNYVLWEMGHPTHVFDLDLLAGGKIIVRRARAGEILKTLDGVERRLSPEDLVIADARRPVALAGIMGGFDSMITGKTRNVLIEAAWFDPATVRKTAKRHGMHTEASHRFERGADFAAAPLACARVAQMILESAGGRPEGGEIDALARHVPRPAINLRGREVARILGQEIAPEEMQRILRRLGFTVLPRPQASAAAEGAAFSLQPPTWRLDIDREIDVIEEIARLHGYDNFPNTLPQFSGAVVALPDERKDALLRRTLLALGYDEAMSWTFIGAADARTFAPAEPLALENPISDEDAVMRTSLLPGMLQMLAWNLNRGNSAVRLFEAGHVFAKLGEDADERKCLSLGATGAAEPGGWERPARAYSFFDMKGDIEELLRMFAHRELYFDGPAAEFFHPGRAARAVLDGATVAQFGQLHPELAAARKLRQDVFVGEIYLDRLYAHALREPRYTPIPRFPAVDRDFSFQFDDSVTFARIAGAVAALRIAELRSLVPLEIFRGGTLPAGKYSLLLRAGFQSPSRTLTDEEVAVWAQHIIKALQALGGVQRA
jgi:phenylalanyl-tRNA synthetase beta chain